MRLNDYLNTLPFISLPAQKTWDWMNASESFSFVETEGPIFSSKNFDFLKLILTHAKHPNSFIPIRTFRRPTPPFLNPTDVHRLFLSSGTTTKEGERSHSGFSRDGLLLYKAASLKTFSDLLGRLFSNQDPTNIPVLSLIPPPQVWPTSSLAQMLAWIAEFWPVTYIKDVEQLTQGLKTKTPVIVFGTGFHFVNLIDEGFKTILPRGSYIIETGGTKGKSRSVTRRDLYRMLSDGLGVDGAHIVGEYGMCELASQAYDWLDPNSAPVDIEDRTFRLPFWAPIWSMDHPSEAKAQGTGALLIWDRARIDCPAPIQVEDLADVVSSHAFRLLGRIPSAPLKGCSLHVERTSETSPHTEAGFSAPATVPPLARSGLDLRHRARILHTALPQFLKSAAAHASLATELESHVLASSALDDILQCLPQSEKEWLRAIERSEGHASTPWYFILPGNHSIAGLYPLALGFGAGLTMHVRIPASEQRGPTLAHLFCDWLQKQDAALTFLPPSLRIESRADIPANVNALVYGDDETITYFRHIAPGRVSGFGWALAISILDQRDLPEAWPHLLKDAFALGQRGCMSVRLAIVLGGNKIWGQGKIWGHPTESELIQLGGPKFGFLEYNRLQQEGFTLSPWDPNQPIFAQKSNVDPQAPLQQHLSPAPFILPMIGVSDVSPFLAHPDVKVVTVSSTLFSSLSSSRSDLRLGPLGSANRPPWDGWHLGRPIFRPS